MGKVNINDTKATKTARKGESKRGEVSVRVREDLAGDVSVEKNVGVKMAAKDGKSEVKNKASKVQSSKSRALVVVKEKPTVKPKNIEVHDPEVDEGLALMASRAAAREFQKPDITKLQQQRRKSMSGMLVETTHPVNHAHMAEDTSKSEPVETKPEDKKSNTDKEKFSKMNSILIGVGVAVVVAVIGFAGIAIFGSNKEKCTVSFESNGGSKIEATEIVCGRTVKRPTDPTKEGFEFDGWIFDGDPFDFTTEIYKNAVLVAKWKADEDTETVTVSFDTDGGTAVLPVEVAKGKTMHEPNEPTKTNWTFTGWYLGDEKFDFSEPIDADMTLKAGWKWAPVANGGTTTSRPSGSGGGNNSGSSSNNDKPTIDDQNNGNTDNSGNTGNEGGNSGDNNGGSNENQGGNEGDNSGDNSGGNENQGGNQGGNSGGDNQGGGENQGGDDNQGGGNENGGGENVGGGNGDSTGTGTGGEGGGDTGQTPTE